MRRGALRARRDLIRCLVAVLGVTLVVLGAPAPAPADPPTMALPGSFSVEATGPSGAVVTYSVTVTDDYPNPGLACSPSSGATFPLGVATVPCQATGSHSDARR